MEHPATEMLIKYLNDSAKEESQLLSDAILNGSIISDLEQCRVSTICLTLRRIAEVDLEEIEDFYKEEKEDD